jgi:hypothetical protein
MQLLKPVTSVTSLIISSLIGYKTSYTPVTPVTFLIPNILRHRSASSTVPSPEPWDYKSGTSETLNRRMRKYPTETDGVRRRSLFPAPDLKLQAENWELALARLDICSCTKLIRCHSASRPDVFTSAAVRVGSADHFLPRACARYVKEPGKYTTFPFGWESTSFVARRSAQRPK